MSKARRKHSSKPAPSVSSTRNRAGDVASADTAQEDRLHQFAQLAAAGLLTARFFVPAESAPLGETLWIVALWLLVTVLALWTWLRGSLPRFGLRRIDIAVYMLVLGQISAGVIMSLGEGQRRAAANMLWEWFGLLLLYLLLRALTAPRADDSDESSASAGSISTATAAGGIWQGFVWTAVVLAGFGLWQHYFWYPQLIAEYDAIQAELEAPASSGSSLSQRRRHELQAQLTTMGVPLDGSARKLWEQRLKESTEPLGFFALANTFAGLLMLALILLTCDILWRQRTGRASLAFWLTATAVVCYCLLLTKSRTAWVGSLVGIGVGVLLQLRRRAVFSRITKRYVIVGSLLLVALVGVLGLTGSLDEAIVSEAPKSLKYRLEYWQGTWEVIKQHPWVGVGPGNFRQHYLQFKLPQSSEEISDPHNLFLDVWVNGGLLSLVGLVLFLCFTLQTLLTAAWKGEGETDAKPPLATRNPQFTTWLLGTGGGLLLVAGYQITFQGSADSSIWLLAVCWACGLWAFAPLREASPVSAVGLTAGLIGLCVHLLGAGGIAMPAVTQLLLLLGVFAAGLVGQQRPVKRYPVWERRLIKVGLVIAPLSLLGFLYTGLLPVVQRESLISAGDVAWISSGRPDLAHDYYQQAFTADPLSPQPWERLAQLDHRLWEQSPTDDKEKYFTAIGELEEAILRDPFSYTYYQLAGQWSLQRFRRTGESGDAEAAVRWLQQAVERYPHLASQRVIYAEALHAAGQKSQAAEQANLALKQDAVNREAGHLDKLLNDAQLQQLQRLTQSE